MKTLSYSVACFLFVLSSAAQTTAPKPVQKTASRVPLTIPASAVKQPDGNYRYVDSKGTAWVYRNTPFGVSRSTEAAMQASAGPSQPTPDGGSTKPEKDRDDKVTAVANGDTIQFARATPFGATRWSKNKADLTADEQKIWDREQSKRNQ